MNRVFNPKLHHLCLCQIREEKCFAPLKATIIKLIIEQMEMKNLAWAIIVSNTLLENLQSLLSVSVSVSGSSFFSGFRNPGFPYALWNVLNITCRQCLYV